MTKSPDAFRTISEVSDELAVPQHVLRFWETKFAQVKPLKRGGGRRYYRPADVDLIRGIKTLLYTDGYTIRGVQKVFRAQGVKYVAEVGRVGGIKLAPVATAKPEAVPELGLDVQVEARSPEKTPMPAAPAAAPAEARPPESKPKLRSPRDFVEKVVPPRVQTPKAEPAQLSLVEPPALAMSDKESARFAEHLAALKKLKSEIGQVLAERKARLSPPAPMVQRPRAARA